MKDEITENMIPDLGQKIDLSELAAQLRKDYPYTEKINHSKMKKTLVNMKGEDGNDVYVLMVWEKTDKVWEVTEEDYNIPANIEILSPKPSNLEIKRKKVYKHKLAGFQELSLKEYEIYNWHFKVYNEVKQFWP